jgi:hypothetical protein
MASWAKRELLMALMVHFVCRYDDGLDRVHAALDTVESVGQEMFLGESLLNGHSFGPVGPG